MEKADVCMTDKSWIALNLSRKKKLLLMGSVGLRQRTPEYEKMDEVRHSLIDIESNQKK